MGTREEILVRPEELQSKIATIVSKYPHARAFVRPSGTENVLRLYAEAGSLEHVDALTKEIQIMLADVV